MKKVGMAFVLTWTVILLAACSVPGENPDHAESLSTGSSGISVSGQSDAYHKISAEEAKQMMDEEEVTIVDVRTPEEYEEAHVPGAIMVPVETIGDEKPEALPDEETILLVYCRTGVRSKAASEKLVELGYQKVYDFGGIVDWPYETVKGEE